MPFALGLVPLLVVVGLAKAAGRAQHLKVAGPVLDVQLRALQLCYQGLQLLRIRTADHDLPGAVRRPLQYVQLVENRDALIPRLPAPPRLAVVKQQVAIAAIGLG